MSTQILIKRSTTTGAVPTTSDIATGELAINTVDKRIFTNNEGTIVELGTTPTTQAVTGNASVGGTFDVVGAVTVGNFTADGTVDLTSATVTIPAPTADTHPATKKYVDDEVNAILDGAPAALDTLNEIAAAINDDANLYTTLTNSIATKLSLSGGTMTGSIDMGANSITTSADPATDNTLTRKSYVDGLYQSTVDAEDSATAAAASATAAAGSASSAATSATTATTQASAASTSATNAASSATAAATSATSSANSATASATSATQSAASATQAQALVDSIESFYLGAEASAPTVDDNGDPLQAGDWYFNTTDNTTYIYNGSSWQSVSPDLVSDLTPQLGGDLSTNGNDINFGDNDKAIFGAGSDLQIYHDGSNSYISDAGTGNLNIIANEFAVYEGNGTDLMIGATPNGAVTLSHNAQTKLATTSTGIDVTGTATMDGLTSSGLIKTEGSSLGIVLNETDTTDVNSYINQQSGNLRFMSVNDAFNSFDTRLLINNATGDISFYEDTGTTAKFFWDASAESLGIGTSSPAETLVLNKAANNNLIRFDIAGSAKGYIGTSSLTNGGLTGSTAGDLIIRSEAGLNLGAGGASNIDMRIDSSGNVGIGTSSPAQALAVLSGTASSDIAEFTGVNTGRGLKISTSVENGYNDMGAILDAQGSIGELMLSTAGTERMRIDNYGNVGIGTDSPSSLLTLGGDTNSDGDNSSSITFLNTVSGVVTDEAAAKIAVNADSTGRRKYNLDFYTGQLGASTKRMTLDFSGNLLVGATSYPIGSTGFKIAPSGFARIERSGTTSQFHMSFTNGNGDVGSISTSGSSTAYNTSSDYRLKEDWQPVANASDRVAQLKPVNFAWKASGERVDGFLAHELAEVIPEAVTGTKDAMRTEEYEVSPAVLDDEGNVVTEAVMGTREVPEYQGIDQSKLVPLLTAALQEALSEIDNLKQRVSALETN